jgi:mono/diheme cytochrome c family protein
MRRLLWIAVVLGGPVTVGLAQQSSPEGAELFEKRIRPVLAAKCISCHGAPAAKPKGGLVVDTLAGLLRGGARGPAVAPGDPEKSLLLQAIRRESDDLAMPPKESERLTEAEIQDFAAWIRAGAPGPKPLPAAARASSHWAFAKPRPVAPRK